MKQRNGIGREIAHNAVDFFCRLRGGVGGPSGIAGMKENVINSVRQRFVLQLNALSAREAGERNALAEKQYAEWLVQWQAKNNTATKPRRNPYPTRKAIDYSNVDFKEVFKCAEKLLGIYLDEGEWGAMVRDRYMLSVARALEIMNSPEAHKYGCVQLCSGVSWAYDPLSRHSLWTRLNAEKKRFQAQGVWPPDVERLKQDLAARPSFTISDCLNGNSRALVMLAVLARLMVGCAKDPAVWERNALFKLYEHILCATMRSYDQAFPFHLDMTTDHLRLGRTHDRQNNLVSDYLSAKFFDGTEQLFFAGAIAYFLQGRTDRQEVWRGIAGNERLAKFFTPTMAGEISRSIECVRPWYKSNAH